MISAPKLPHRFTLGPIRVLTWSPSGERCVIVGKLVITKGYVRWKRGPGKPLKRLMRYGRKRAG